MRSIIVLTIYLDSTSFLDPRFNNAQFRIRGRMAAFGHCLFFISSYNEIDESKFPCNAQRCNEVSQKHVLHFRSNA